VAHACNPSYSGGSVWEGLGWMLAHVGINNHPVPKTSTQETKSWQGNFSWSRGCKHVLTPAKQTRKHKMAASSSSLYPWHSCTCPSPGNFPGQRFTISLNWLKGLGNGLGYAVWQAMELYRNWKKRQGPFKHASHLRWQPEEFLSNLRE
jgi:hypothetical protein